MLQAIHSCWRQSETCNGVRFQNASKALDKGFPQKPWLKWSHRENNSDHQYHSNKKQKFQEHRYTPKYWRNEQNGVYQ
eukprot:1596853-Amphidinium_carterae.1